MSDATESAIRDGARAAALLDDPLFVAAWGDIERDLLATWRASPVRDSEGREHLYTMLRLLDTLRAAFVAHVNNGKVAADWLAAIERDRAVNR